MTTIKLGRTETVSLDSVKPYWRNPRKISEEAIEQLAHSISEYGYQQPLVVDKDYTLIVGHTRYAAMRRLGVREVTVLVADHLTPRQVREFRLVDNRSAEYSKWDLDVLTEQLEDLENPERLAGFFPEIQLESLLEADTDGEIDMDDIPPPEEQVLEFVCPSCYLIWEARVTSTVMLAGFIPRSAAVDPVERTSVDS